MSVKTEKDVKIHVENARCAIKQVTQVSNECSICGVVYGRFSGHVFTILKEECTVSDE